jgi:hypothetical protein
MVTALLAVSFLTLAVTAVVPNVPAMIAAAAVSLAVEGVLYRWQRGMVAMFAKMHADVTVRHLLRDMLIVVALVRLHGQSEETDLATPLLVLLGFYALHFSIQAVSVVVRRTRTTPVLTRNIDTSGLRLTAAPPALLLRRAGHRLLIFGLPATVGLLAAGATGEALWGVRLGRHGPDRPDRAQQPPAAGPPPAVRGGGAEVVRRVAGLVQADHRHVLLRRRRLRLPGQHVAGPAGQAGRASADRAA